MSDDEKWLRSELAQWIIASNFWLFSKYYLHLSSLLYRNALLDVSHRASKYYIVFNYQLRNSLMCIEHGTLLGNEFILIIMLISSMRVAWQLQTAISRFEWSLTVKSKSESSKQSIFVILNRGEKTVSQIYA